MSSSGVRFAAIVGTMDEADMLPLVIEHLRRIGVGLIIVVDRGSTDGSLEVAAEAEEQGDVWLIRTEPDEPTEVVSDAGIALARSSGAEWILIIDSDELPLPRTGSLHDLADLAKADVLSMMRYNVILRPGGLALPQDISTRSYDEVLLWAQPLSDPYHVIGEDPEMPWIRGVLEPKVLIRTVSLDRLHAGGHGVGTTRERPWRQALARDLVIAHAPFRTLERFQSRSANIQHRVAARPEWFRDGQGWQWVRFAKMADEGRTEEEFQRQVTEDDELAELRASTMVRSVSELFERLIPKVETEEQYVAMAGRAQPWVSAAGLACQREGISPDGILKHVSTLWYPTVLIPEDHVIKFYGDWKEGRITHDREVRSLEALEALESDGTFAVPRLVARDILDEDYQYLIMSRVPGHSIDSVSQHVQVEALREVAGWLGGVVRTLHALPLSEQQREAGWSHFQFIVTWRHEHIREIMAKQGYAEALIEEAPAWLPPTTELITRPEESVFCHGDLTDTNIMGWPKPPHFEPSGIIDFNQSFVGHPLSELGPIWFCALKRDRAALDAFLETAQLPGTDEADFPRQALAWALINPCWGKLDLSDIADISSLDELAEHWFGSRSAS